MKNNIKLIIFDAYGVTMSRGYPDTYAALHKRFGIPIKKMHEIIYKKYFNMAAERKISQKEAWQRPVEELNLPITWQELRDIHLGLLKVNKQTMELVKQLRRKYSVIMLSKNTRSQFAYTKNKHPQLWKSFDQVINTWELNLPKASKKTISVLLKRFKVKPDEIVYVDDQKANLSEAKKMGVKTIFYQNFKQFKRELKNIIPLAPFKKGE